MNLAKLVRWMDGELRVGDITDYPNALNGLQLENDGTITRVAAGVDASEATMQLAIEEGADLLLVHHGLFWSGLTPLTGAFGRKVRLAVEHNLAVYSAHLPLDLHPRLGNNAKLAAALALGKNPEPFLERDGRALGLAVDCKVNREVLAAAVEKAVGGRVHMCPGGPVVARRVGIATGGAGGDVARAVAEGVDTFITGEGPHWSYTLAEELGLNVLYAGHYATETFGVKALAAEVSDRFEVPWCFVDHPTGL